MYKYKTRVYLIVFPKEKAIQDCLETDSTNNYEYI